MRGEGNVGDMLESGEGGLKWTFGLKCPLAHLGENSVNVLLFSYVFTFHCMKHWTEMGFKVVQLFTGVSPHFKVRELRLGYVKNLQ